MSEPGYCGFCLKERATRDDHLCDDCRRVFYEEGVIKKDWRTEEAARWYARATAKRDESTCEIVITEEHCV